MRLPVLQRKLSAPLAILAAVVIAWLLYKAAFAAYWLVGVVLLLGGSYWLVRPELRTLLGSAGDHRPWLVRLREHRWRPIALGGGYRMPRVAAYLFVALLWWFWL